MDHVRSASQRSPLRFTFLLAVLASGLAAPAAAQRLFAPDQASGGLVELDPVDGSVVSLVAVDLPSLTGGASMLPVAGTQLPNGEIWISDLSANAVFRLDRSATTYLGAIPVVLDQPRQLVPYSGGVLLANGGFDGGAPGPGLIHLDAQGQIVAFFATTQPFGLLPFELAGVDGYLYTEFGFRAVTFADASNLALQTMFAPVGGAAFTLFPEDLAQRANGNVLVASFISPSGIYELDPSGQVVQYLDPAALGGVTGTRCVHELGNGNLLFGGSTGLYVLDVSTQSVTVVATGVLARSFFEVSSDLGTRYCTALPNSLGAPGVMGAFGSRSAADNDVTLRASELPPMQFGIFVVSMVQASTPVPNSGVLCLGGQIGRYQSIPQIFLVDAGGNASLAIDLTAVPQPGGLVAVQPGDTWNFQGWHRDLGPSVPPSNFTDGYRIDFQ